MKKLCLMIGILAMANTVSAETTGIIRVERDWSLVSCKQLENGGKSFYKRDFQGAEVVILKNDSNPISYEIYINEIFRASCKFVSVDY